MNIKNEKFQTIGHWTYSWARLQDDLIPHYIETIDSTNLFAKKCPYSTKKNQVIISDDQTHGRGRNQNSWLSPQKGSALFSSWVFDLDYIPQPILAPLIGLDVYEALFEIRGFSNIALKAPNDIYMNDKKVCGILIETITQGSQSRLIVGVGMNVTDTPHLATAGCIENFRSQNIDECAWGGFLIEFYKRLKLSVKESQKNQILPEKCKRILIALNQFQLLDQKYQEILPSGEIKTQSRIIPWFEI